jgi:hypothetical protein
MDFVRVLFFSLGLARESLSDYEPFESQGAKRLLLMKYEVFGVVKLFWSLAYGGLLLGNTPRNPNAETLGFIRSGSHLDDSFKLEVV